MAGWLVNTHIILNASHTLALRDGPPIGLDVVVWLWHGTDDRLTVPAASKIFVDQVSGDVTLIEYDGMYHEPHNEPEQAEVFADVMEWLNKHLP